jgi:hypothetical protein
MSSFNPYKPLATLKGKRSKATFKFFWNAEDKHIYIEKSGFFSSSKVKLGQIASSWDMAYHAAEAYVFDK